MEEKYYGYALKLRVGQTVLVISAALVAVVFAAHLVVTTTEQLFYLAAGGEMATSETLYTPDWFVFVLVCGVPLLLWWFVFAAIFLTMLPSITVGESGFRVHSLLGGTDWLGWDAIRKAREVPVLGRAWIIGIEKLGWLYWPTGFFFWLWMPGLYLTQSIDDYHGLMRVLKEKRPDLFAPYRVDTGRDSLPSG
jgi:hypothetical protein